MKQIKIGRSSTCDVVINDNAISREHAELFVDDEGNKFLTDLESSNGTFINGKQLKGSEKIQFNDIIKIGNTVLPWRNYLKGDYNLMAHKTEGLSTESGEELNSAEEKKFKIPVFVGWIINILAWTLFILTFDHIVELLMCGACLFAVYIGYKHKNNNLLYSSIFDAIWMLTWGIGLFDEFNIQGFF